MRNHNEALDNSQKVQFPWKLHAILEETETCGHDAIISWLPNGLGFKVHDKDAFAEEVMPKYFSSNKFKTFQRNLNLWGFQTLTRDPDRGAAFHPHFIRGKPDECNQMERVRVKKEMKHKKVILKPTGELEPLQVSGSFRPSSPRSQEQATMCKVISPTSSPPPLEPNSSFCPINMAPSLTSKQSNGNLPNNNSNNALSNNSFSMTVRHFQDYFALECLRTASLQPSLNHQTPSNGLLPTMEKFSRAVSTTSQYPQSYKSLTLTSFM
ncbi:unnamed protein product [Cylindrotheca closterium]|uniref:HSF-type DNA-binding domain-containing protein n=1 Tax=Cylindrotheca closterium TaxID=2856 RepID=A0AAD2CY53_9STRA|nr:unnamed protein product [Cylindrotheca closterium]